MSRKKSTNDKVAKNAVETDFDDSKSEKSAFTIEDLSDEETDKNSVIKEVEYKINSVTSPHLSSLISFLSEPKFIRDKGDISTNIIDRIKNICYNIPDNKIGKFFTIVESCRRSNIKLMMAEKQAEYSGIMLDFDIYQESTVSLINDNITSVLSENIIKIINDIVDFKSKDEIVVYICITKRPNIKYEEEKKCYKDGIHILIPGIKIQKNVKKYIIKRIIETEILDTIFTDIQPANITIKGRKYTRSDFVDINSAHVPVFLIGSSTKPGNNPYRLFRAYKAIIKSNAVFISSDKSFKSDSVNICHEFSLNYELTGGIIRKVKYEPYAKYIDEIESLYSKKSTDEEDLAKNYSLLSIESIRNNRVKEIKDLLDILKEERADDYSQWFDILCVLANTSKDYKNLAEYYSRKSKKFSTPEFEKLWNGIISGKNKNKKLLSIASLHYWAQQDNKERYIELKKHTIFATLYTMIYEPYTEGILNHNNVATLLYKELHYKFITDIPEDEKKRVWYEFMLDDDKYIDGELYKWHAWTDIPSTLSKYISMNLTELFKSVMSDVKKNIEKFPDNAKYYNTILKNYKGTIRKLGDVSFKNNVIKAAEVLFDNRGFAKMLDKDPCIRGVKNGVLKLSTTPGGKPILIQGYHTYLVSKYTNVPYIAFNPYDPLTKKMLISLRSMFPDNETDSFEFTMGYFSSTIDGNFKESMFMLMVGGGANGKSFLVELHKSAIGNIYGVKLPLASLTNKFTNPEAATPAMMLLKDATLATYSESSQNEVLNAARIKELTGLETVAGRKLHQNIINFKPRCHHLVTTNYDFIIESNDHGTWRRIKYNRLKIKFVLPNDLKGRELKEYERYADTSLNEWTEDPEIQGRYLGWMVYWHHKLYSEYGGKVLNIPHPHINLETDKYKARQDTITLFLTQRLVNTVSNTNETPLNDEIKKYIDWHTLTFGPNVLNSKGLSEQLQNSLLSKYVKTTKRDVVLLGVRFLGNKEEPAEGETFTIQNIYSQEEPANNFNVIIETPEQFYDRICKEYETKKHLFSDEIKYNVDVDLIKNMNNNNYNNKNDNIIKRKDNLSTDDKIITDSGIILRELPERKYKTYDDDMLVMRKLLGDDYNSYIPEIDGDNEDDDNKDVKETKDDTKDASKDTNKDTNKDTKNTKDTKDGKITKDVRDDKNTKITKNTKDTKIIKNIKDGKIKSNKKVKSVKIPTNKPLNKNTLNVKVNKSISDKESDTDNDKESDTDVEKEGSDTDDDKEDSDTDTDKEESD